ncbi:hypothetical protein [Maritimibacter sp. UBA3975]|uniref:hypothetical protein n=1 Tax=Maritimibacter sp. UBA3975 TaxID=1946833 RepID=UPI000C0B9FF4|nr:hypothetical protein [Maritimibacter sp. UBA3975]MAM60689.1 hypothetical protein [Maritimibacter sp.]|tara:strand:+ start:2486 stop:2860 length:375 start_codon:yes stop_codon:yes gene_type:complete
MKSRLFALAALLALAACTEQDLCVLRNTQDLRAAESRIGELEGNVARGYAIHRSTEPYEYRAVCRDRDGEPYECTKTDFRTVETPVPIDVADQRRQLAALKARLPALQEKANLAKAQCAQLYPE